MAEPTPRHPLDRLADEGWVLSNRSRCRSCHAEIAWMINPAMHRIPFDLDGKSHFATCSAADYWKGRSRG